MESTFHPTIKLHRRFVSSTTDILKFNWLNDVALISKATGMTMSSREGTFHKQSLKIMIIRFDLKVKLFQKILKLNDHEKTFVPFSNLLKVTHNGVFHHSPKFDKKTFMFQLFVGS